MSDVVALEKQLSDAKELISQKDLAIKLSKNQAFRKLILEEFCTADCARYAQESADPGLSPEAQQDALSMAQAAGHLRRWLSIKFQMGAQAESQLQDLEDGIDDARAEEDMNE